MGIFRAHVEEEFEAAHSNGPEDHKCHVMHGHTWLAEVEFSYAQLNDHGWGPDFGVIKGFMKVLDHQNLNELFGGNSRNVSVKGGYIITDRFPPSAENIAQWLYQRIQLEVDSQGGAMHWVRVSEGGGNQITYSE